MDFLDDAQQPRCPKCGTVLQTQGAGFVCRPCGLTVIGSITSAVSE